MLKSSLIKLHAAATIFTSRGGCAAKMIAEILRIPLNSVYHFAKMPEWDDALDTLGYEGDRQFSVERTRDPQRDSGELVAQARALYITHRRRGDTHKKAVTAASTTLAIDRRRINQWHSRYNWEGVPDE